MAFDTAREQFDGKMTTAPERDLGNVNVNLTNVADSRLAVSYSAGTSAEATLNSQFGTPAIFNGDDTMVPGADPTKNPQSDSSFTAWKSRHVKSIAGNDQYVSATSTKGDMGQAQLDATTTLHRAH